MTREEMIQEYRDLCALQEERRKALDELYDRIKAIKEVQEFDQRWLNAIEERFDREFGCRSGNKNVRWHLHCYIANGEEVPE